MHSIYFWTVFLFQITGDDPRMGETCYNQMAKLKQSGDKVFAVISAGDVS